MIKEYNIPLNKYIYMYPGYILYCPSSQKLKQIHGDTAGIISWILFMGQLENCNNNCVNVTVKYRDPSHDQVH